VSGVFRSEFQFCFKKILRLAGMQGDGDDPLAKIFDFFNFIGYILLYEHIHMH